MLVEAGPHLRDVAGVVLDAIGDEQMEVGDARGVAIERVVVVLRVLEVGGRETLGHRVVGLGHLRRHTLGRIVVLGFGGLGLRFLLRFLGFRGRRGRLRVRNCRIGSFRFRRLGLLSGGRRNRLRDGLLALLGTGERGRHVGGADDGECECNDAENGDFLDERHDVDLPLCPVHHGREGG